ncbi:MAG: hypothetical protein EOP04_21385 [Proteobacteria bacterium]|nr:MAG: hypothetical protein EOP04_21385 [Pseudomonadota bacterium]
MTQVKFVHLKSLQTRLKAIKGPATVNRHLSTYKHFFKEAIRHDWKTDNPAQAIEALPVSHEISFKAWDAEAQDIFISSCEALWMKRKVKAFFISGQRPSTIGRWKWADVDFSKGIIRGYQKEGRGGMVAFDIPMSGALRDLLREMRRDNIVGMSVWVNEKRK